MTKARFNPLTPTHEAGPPEAQASVAYAAYRPAPPGLGTRLRTVSDCGRRKGATFRTHSKLFRQHAEAVWFAVE